LGATTPALSVPMVPQAASQEGMVAIATAPAELRTAATRVTSQAPSAAAATLAASWGITTTAIILSPQSKIATTPALSSAETAATLGALWGKSQQAMSATAITSGKRGCLALAAVPVKPVQILYQ